MLNHETLGWVLSNCPPPVMGLLGFFLRKTQLVTVLLARVMRSMDLVLKAMTPSQYMYKM